MKNRRILPILIAAWIALLLVQGNAIAEEMKTEQAKTFVLPVKNELPLTPDSWCVGAQKASEQAQGVFAAELAVLCNGNTATADFTALFNQPYIGTPASDNFRRVTIGQTPNGFVSVSGIYSLRAQNDPVKVHLLEEKAVLDPYSNDLGVTSIQSTFLEAPINSGDADTVFSIKQDVSVFRNQTGTTVEFDDTTNHTLKLYTIHPDNFDFFLAVRTLDQTTDQFNKSVVLRGVIRDPNDSNQSIAFSVMSFQINDQDGGGNVAEGIVNAFARFITDDMVRFFNRQLPQ